MKKTSKKSLSAAAIASAQTAEHSVMRIAHDDLVAVNGGMMPIGGRLCGGTNTCLALTPIDPEK